MKLAHDSVQWRVLVFLASKLRVMAPENYLNKIHSVVRIICTRKLVY
jgi:hypothetical protein